MQNTITIGMDLGNKKHIVVVFDSNGYEILVPCNEYKAGYHQVFQGLQRSHGDHRSGNPFTVDQSLT